MTEVPRKSLDGRVLQRNDSAADPADESTGGAKSTTPAGAHERWERIRLLTGPKLASVSGRSTFEILPAENDVVLIRIQSTGSERSIRRQEFDKAVKLGLVTSSVTPYQIREAGVSKFSPAHVAAIIRTVLDQSS